MSMQHELNFMKSSIESRPFKPGRAPVVAVGTPLGEVFHKCIDLGAEHALVVNNDGGLFGVATMTAIGDATRSWADGTVWFDRPVESIVMLSLDSEFSPGQTNGAKTERVTGDCLSVFEDNALVALMTENDSLLSWNRIEQAISHAATDPVTLLPNRAHFDRRFVEEWDRAGRLGTTIGIAMIDVDYFKRINDRFGHSAGDRVLKNIADCCREQLRSYDLLARHGGDEFAAIFCARTSEELDVPIARLLTSVNQLSVGEGEESPLSLSMGIAVMAPGTNDCSPEQLVATADRCLYESKNKGRNQAHLATVVDDHPATSRQIVADSGREAILDLQPY